MRRLNSTGAQNDSISRNGNRSFWANRVDSHCRGSGETQAHRPRPRQQGQVRASQSRHQISRTRSNTHTVDDVERDRTHSRRQLRSAIIEVGDPGKPGLLRGGQETFSGAGHFVSTANQDWPGLAMCGTAEIQVRLDGAEVVENVRPCPAGNRGAIEIARQSAAEIPAVDRAGTPDRRPPHDRQSAHGPSVRRV